MRDARTIHRLRLRAQGEADVRAMAVRFEDALRTASLPDPGGRLVYVRRLDLGRIAGTSTAMRLSRLLAEAFERERPDCVHGGQQAAGDAPAVWFGDALDAHTRLALRVASGQAHDAWFWRLAVPGVTAHAPPAARLRAIVLSLAALPEAPAALPRWSADLVHAGHAALLLAALDAPTVAALRRVADHPPPTPGAPLPDTVMRSIAPHDDAAATAHATVARTAATPLRDRPALALLSAWLRRGGDAVALARLEASVRTVAPAVAPVVPRAPLSRAAPPQPAATHASRAAPRRIAAAAPAPDEAAPDRVAAPAARAVGAPPSRVVEADRRSSTPPAVDAPATPHAPFAAIPLPDGAPTMAGGIGFLLPALERLGYPQWCEAHPPWAARAILQRVFAHALHAIGAPDDDPAWRLADIPRMAGPAPRTFLAPPRWRAGTAPGAHDADRGAGARGPVRMRTPPIGVLSSGMLSIGMLSIGVLTNDVPSSRMRSADMRSDGMRPDGMFRDGMWFDGVRSSDTVATDLPAGDLLAGDLLAGDRLANNVCPGDTLPLGTPPPGTPAHGAPAQRVPGLRRAGRDRLAWTDASGRLPLAAWWGHACQDARADVDAALGADAWDGLPACVLPECMPFECTPFECMPPARPQSKGARPECVRDDHASNGTPLPADPDLLVAAAWSLALRRWLRRYARIGLVDLLRRPARLTLTPTHLNLAFAPTQAELRVRRAGLDIDPGWLPWYGRVVGFRYARDAGDTLPPGAS